MWRCKRSSEVLHHQVMTDSVLGSYGNVYGSSRTIMGWASRLNLKGSYSMVRHKYHQVVWYPASYSPSKSQRTSSHLTATSRRLRTIT